jgi:hypothetical protein
MKSYFPFVFYLHSILIKLDINLRRVIVNNMWIQITESSQTQELISKTMQFVLLTVVFALYCMCQ